MKNIFFKLLTAPFVVAFEYTKFTQEIDCSFAGTAEESRSYKHTCALKLPSTPSMALINGRHQKSRVTKRLHVLQLSAVSVVEQPPTVLHYTPTKGNPKGSPSPAYPFSGFPYFDHLFHYFTSLFPRSDVRDYSLSFSRPCVRNFLVHAFVTPN